MSKLQTAVAKNAAAKKQEVSNANTGVSADEKRTKGIFEAYLAKGAADMLRMLGSKAQAGMLVQCFFDAAKASPKLWQCTPASIYQCMMASAKTGLYPGYGGEVFYNPVFSGKKQCYEATFIPMYKGLVQLAFESDKVGKISAHVFYENDFFEYKLGLEEVLNHVPARENRGKKLGAYAIITLTTGEKSFEVMFEPEIALIRDKSPGANSPKFKESVWFSERDSGEMWKKTVLRRLLKLNPSSRKMHDILQAEDEGVDAILSDTEKLTIQGVAGTMTIDQALTVEQAPVVIESAPIEVEQTPDWDAIAAESAGSQLSFIEKDSQPPVG